MDDEGRQSKSQLSRFSGGILGRAKQTVINGGTFTNVISAGKGMSHFTAVYIKFKTRTKDHQVGFDTLQKHVSSAAFHNASDRVDPPRCHENTRRVVLQEILSWMILADTERAAWMAWLNGAAGAGKSAICQTIAEMCATQGIHVASFFFFRTDPTRNTIQPLVATLVYQMIQLVPEIKDIILSTIEGNPLIFQQSLATQLDELVIKPLRWLQFSGSVLKLRFIIDGVDECSGSEHQLDIIHTFSKFLAVKDCPIILLLGSRAERHLQPAFRSSRVSQILLQLPLDDNYLSDNDIYIFIRDKFAEIKATHSFSHLINVTWPPPSIVQEIVDKSSGQFIYASVVMKFISDPRSHPESQLAIIHGLRPSGFGPPLPFAQLDTFYRHIFSQVQNIELLATLLAYIIIGRSAAIDDLVRFFSMSEADVHIAFADLPSVIACQDGEIRFLHASLPDFLLDEARSGGYYINPTIWSTRLCIYWLQNASSGHFKSIHSPLLLYTNAYQFI